MLIQGSGKKTYFNGNITPMLTVSNAVLTVREICPAGAINVRMTLDSSRGVRDVSFIGVKFIKLVTEE